MVMFALGHLRPGRLQRVRPCPLRRRKRKTNPEYSPLSWVASHQPRSSPRTRGPITTGVHCQAGFGSSIIHVQHRWLWVPARASLGRDDLACLVVESTFRPQYPSSKRPLTHRHDFADSPRFRASSTPNVPPSEIRGRRECRAPVAPAAARGGRKHAR